jgi:putative transposase
LFANCGCQREEAIHPIKWKAKYRGLDVSEARRLKGLEDENRPLKRLLAEAMLDNAALKDLLGKNG